MGAKLGRVVIAVVLAVSFLAPGAALAGADDLAKQADKIIRNAERKMFSGDNQEADDLLNEASALIEQAKAEDPNNKNTLRAEKNLERIREGVGRKLGKTAGRASSSGPGLPKKPEPKGMSSNPPGPARVVESSGLDKLPGGVTKRLKDISGDLDDAERYATSNAKNAQYKLKKAGDLFAEIEKNYSGQFDPAHPDYAVVRNRFDDLTGRTADQGAVEAKAAADAAGAEAAKEKQSAEWVAKFRQYLSYPGQEGHNPDKLVFVPGTSEPEKFADAQRRYEAFEAFYSQYKNTEFPNGKTWELEDLADTKAPLRLKEFEEGFASRVASVAGDADTEIDAAMRQLEKDNGWTSDKTKKPNIVDHKWMTSIREATERVTAALGESDPKRRETQARFDALVAKDKENRQIRKERTFMTPDRYTGGDIGELKEKAESLVQSDRKEGGRPLRCTIISQDWQEETVEEWTDTSKTARRRRTTRSLTAQVAAQSADGVRLVTVALAKDRRSDGSWGPLYGNLHPSPDPMLESNVNP